MGFGPPTDEPGLSSSHRSPSWKWGVCGVLLLASAINYMDRQVLANAASRVTREFQLSQEEYGNLELGFGWAFGVDSLCFGIIVDRVSARWLYPLVLLLWSTMGFVTGFVEDYTSLVVCRTLLGFFEAGHWPCALKTTQQLLEPRDRSMGNSVLQSGASIGAIATPLLLSVLLTQELSSWRFAFQVVGAMGALWVVLWFAFIRRQDLALPPRRAPGAWAGLRTILSNRRMLTIFVVVVLINIPWQISRAWLPKFLQEGRGYPEKFTLYFNSFFYAATDVGCIGAGALTLWLHRRGLSVHGARQAVFGLCACLTACLAAAAFLPAGWLMLSLLLVAAAGSLGLFPIYYSLTQDISTEHQGKVTGLGGVVAWTFSSPTQTLFGWLVDVSGSFNLGLAIAGLMPLVGFAALWLLWEQRAGPAQLEKGDA